jgi:hypothetical protein
VAVNRNYLNEGPIVVDHLKSVTVAGGWALTPKLASENLDPIVLFVSFAYWLFGFFPWAPECVGVGITV